MKQLSKFFLLTLIGITLNLKLETGNCFAQATTFQKIYKSNISYSNGGLTAPYDVLQTYDEGYVMIGESEDYSLPLQIDIVKTDNQGVIVWKKRIKLQKTGHLASIRQTADSGYIITGDENWNFFLLKLDKTGNVTWIKSYDGSTLGHYAQQTKDGGYIIIGNSTSANIHLIKTDAKGSVVWSKTYGGNGNGGDEGWDIKETADGGYIVLGSTKGNFNLKWQNIYLIKTDKNGTVLWTKIHGNNTDDFWGYSIKQTMDKGYIISGFTEPILDFDSINNSVTVGDWDMFLMKTDTNGNAEWAKSFQNTSSLAWDDYAYEIEQTKDSGYVFVGKSHDDSFYSDISLVKTDAKGTVIWSKAYGDISQTLYIAEASSMQQTQDGGFIISGVTRDFNTQQNFLYLIKTDDAGNAGCRQVDLPLKDSTWILNTNSGCIVGNGGVGISSAFSMGTLSITDSSLCSCTLPMLTLTSDNTICKGDTAILMVRGADTYTWTPTTGLSSATDSVVKAFPLITTTYKVVGKNGCGNSSGFITLTVNPSSSISISGNTGICEGSNTMLTASGGTTYSWNTGVTTAAITVSPTIDSTYTVTVKDANNCTSNKSVTVKVNPLPTANITGTTTICNGSNTLLTASGGTIYSWNTGKNTAAITVAPSFTTTYIVTVSNVASCSVKDSVNVIVNSSPTISIRGNASILKGSSTTLTATGGINYKWNTNNTADTTASITVSPTSTTAYIVTGTDASGCSTAETITIKVIEEEIKCGEVFVPSAFSPNDDKQNDLECIMGNCIQTLHFAIYDRWGEKVFETIDPNNICWDGTYNGKPMDAAMFVYSLEATLSNGNKVIKKGNVTLIR